MQHLDFCKQTPRPSATPEPITVDEEEAPDVFDDDAVFEQQNMRPMSAKTTQHSLRFVFWCSHMFWCGHVV